MATYTDGASGSSANPRNCQAVDAQLRITANGFSVLGRDSGSSVSIEWADVREILAFKRDFITSDEVCLAFRNCDGWVEISESDDGFAQILAELKRNFPSVPDGWYTEVMLPPFETCEQVLFRSEQA